MAAILESATQVLEMERQRPGAMTGNGHSRKCIEELRGLRREGAVDVERRTEGLPVAGEWAGSPMVKGR